jgi:hypothetical protein
MCSFSNTFSVLLKTSVEINQIDISRLKVSNPKNLKKFVPQFPTKEIVNLSSNGILCGRMETVLY